MQSMKETFAAFELNREYDLFMSMLETKPAHDIAVFLANDVLKKSHEADRDVLNFSVLLYLLNRHRFDILEEVVLNDLIEYLYTRDNTPQFLLLTKNVEAIHWIKKVQVIRYCEFFELFQMMKVPYMSEMACHLLQTEKNSSTERFSDDFTDELKVHPSYIVLKQYINEITPKYYTTYAQDLIKHFNRLFATLPIPSDLVVLIKRYA